MSEKYCDECYIAMHKKKDQILKRFLRLHIYLYQLVVDRRLTYSQLCRLVSILSKDREWALHAHYQQFGVYRPPNWRGVELDNNIQPESEIFEHGDEIREYYANANEIGFLEFFAGEDGMIASME